MWFLPSNNQQLLVTGFEPALPVTQSVIVVPPFAEEMNKSRKLMSDFCRSVVGADGSSTAVYMIDLFGCGDSEGVLSQASWPMWRHNIADLLADLKQQHPLANHHLLGIRLGAALALDCCINELHNQSLSLIFWQPALNGAQFINQFMRLKIAAAMAQGTTITTAQLREELADKQLIEISGYEVSRAMVNAIDGIALHQLDRLPSAVRLAWFEVSPDQQLSMLPISKKIIERWSTHSQAVGDACHGERFWQTAVTVTAPCLITRTGEYLTEGGDA